MTPCASNSSIADTKIEDFKLLRKLGEGTYGRAFLAIRRSEWGAEKVFSSLFLPFPQRFVQGGCFSCIMLRQCVLIVVTLVVD